MLAAFTVIALVLFLPSTPLYKSLPSFWGDTIPKIVLGLDLQGRITSYNVCYTKLLRFQDNVGISIFATGDRPKVARKQF